LRYAFGRPHQESLVWLPDLVAGAVADALGGQTTRHLAALGDSVSVVDVGPSG